MYGRRNKEGNTMGEQKTLLEKLTPDEITSIAKIITSIAARFVIKFPFLVMDDCIQMAWKEFIIYQSYYDPTKSKVTTWAYKLVQDTLTSYAMREHAKTQSWDNIEDFTFEDERVCNARDDCCYQDFLATMEKILSPCAFKLLKKLEENPKVCFTELSTELRLSQRDLVYLRDELRLSAKYVQKGLQTD